MNNVCCTGNCFGVKSDKPVDNGPVLDIQVNAPGWGEVVVQQPVDGLTLEVMRGMEKSKKFMLDVALEAAKELCLADEDILLDSTRVLGMAVEAVNIANDDAVPQEVALALCNVSVDLQKLFEVLRKSGY